MSYTGTTMHGVAPQPGLRTLASELTHAIFEASSSAPVALNFSSRTDAGVHARHQVVSFRLPGPPNQDLAHALQLGLPPDVELLELDAVPRSFNARQSSLWKHYRYRILQGALTSHPQAWCVAPPLSLERMQDLASALVGTHNFHALRSPRCAAPNPVKTLHVVQVRQRPVRDGVLTVVDVVGDGFLRQMVRILAGTLASCGAGWLGKDGVMDALARKDRSGTGPVAPACGLTLWHVEDQWGAERVPARPCSHRANLVARLGGSDATRISS